MGKCECGRLKGNPCGPLRPNTINVTMPIARCRWFDSHEYFIQLLALHTLDRIAAETVDFPDDTHARILFSDPPGHGSDQTISHAQESTWRRKLTGCQRDYYESG